MLKKPTTKELTTICLLALVAIAGCGPEQKVDSNRTIVSGVVTFDGKPLPAGNLVFSATDAPRSASVSIRDGGKYMTDRAPLGSNIVTIETETLQYGSPHLYTKIPAKYADPSQSGLTVEIKPGTNENVNFDLKK